MTADSGNAGPVEAPPSGVREAAEVELVSRLFHAAPLGIFLSDADERCIYANPAYHLMIGLESAQAVGTSWRHSVHPQDRQRASLEWQAAVSGQKPFQSEVRFRRNDGSVVWTRLHAAVSTGQCRHPRLLVVEDITERKLAKMVISAAEEALFAERERAQVTLDSIGDAVLTTDLAGRVTYLNAEAEALTGWSREAATGRPLKEVFRIIDGATRVAAVNPARRAIEEDRTVGLAAGCVLLRHDGSELAIEDSAAPIHDRAGAVVGAVIVFHDVAQSRVVAERMAHLARHDYLTGLANPALLAERLSQAMSLAHRHSKRVALLFLDLNDFKSINDTLGHLVGDRFLQAVATRLAGCVRASDTVCRRGGDEFVILLTEIESARDAAYVAEKVLAAVSEPQIIDGIELQRAASVGISIYPEDGEESAALIQCADSAMYDAKASEPGGYRFFGPRIASPRARPAVLNDPELKVDEVRVET